MAHSQSTDTVRLANQAASLSSELYALQEKCQHESTAGEISTIADELARLSTTLWHLNDAINADPSQYTDAFNEDLKEITTELTAVFEEISECCAGLQMADSSVSAVSWFFKKGRVARLVKHLEALKGTLVVMRTVLWHGKDYGTHRSDRVAESNPHTMHEDRMILESVLAQNRDAIADLHNLANTISSGAQPKSSQRTNSRAGDHHRQLSDSTGVDIPPIPDVLPPGAAEHKDKKGYRTPPNKLKRTFSKRGTRLGVHMSILDLSAHEAPSNLKRKWIQQAHHWQQLGHGRSGNRGVLTALPELSRISEVDTAAGSKTNLHHISPAAPMFGHAPAEPTIPEYFSVETPSRTPNVPTNTPANNNPSTVRKPRSSTISSKVRRVMSRISLNNLRSPTRNRSKSTHRSSIEYSSPVCSIKEESKGSEASTGEEDKSDALSATRKRPTRLDLCKGSRKGQRPFFEMIKQKFEKSPLNTPDVEKEFEYNRN